MVACHALAHAACPAVQIAGHDIPADAAIGEVIQSREPPRELERVLIGQVCGDAEADVAGDMRHG